MSLDYEFVPIDVTLLTHPKADKAGTEAMGLWLFGCCLAKHQRTKGRVPRASVLAAWGGGKRNLLLAKRLVACWIEPGEPGLWLPREDGDWDIWNYDKKAPKLGPDGRSSGARRTKKWREAQRASREPPESHVTVTCDVTPVTRDVTHHVTRDVSASVSVSSGISSRSFLGDPDQDPTCQVGGPPDWFRAAAATAELAVGVAPDQLPSRWLEYSEARKRQGRALNPGDAAAWLTTVMRREIRETADRGPARANLRQPLGDAADHAWIANGGGTL